MKMLCLKDNPFIVQLDNSHARANEAFKGTISYLLSQTRMQAQALSAITQTPMVVIAERLPHITLKTGQMFLWLTDPLTGQESVRSFDLQGDHLAPGSVEDIATSSPWGVNPANPFADRGVNPKLGLQLCATAVIDYTDSITNISAAVRATCTHTSTTSIVNGVLIAVDEMPDARSQNAPTIKTIAGYTHQHCARRQFGLNCANGKHWTLQA